MNGRESLATEARSLLDDLGMMVMRHEADPLWESGEDYNPSGVTTDPDIMDCERFDRDMKRLRELLEQIDTPFEELFVLETHPDDLQKAWDVLCGEHLKH